MPSIYDLKPRFQALLRPISNGLVRIGATANQVTVLALLLSCAVGACIVAFPQQKWPLFDRSSILIHTNGVERN